MTGGSGGTPRVPTWQLMVALWAGIGLWMVHLVVQMGLNGWACASGQLWPFHLVTIVTAVPTVGAGWLGWRIARRGEQDPHVVAARFLGWLAVVMNVLSLVLIVAEWLPVLAVDPCLRT